MSLYQLKIGFREYIDALLVTLGLEGWQEFVTEQSYKIDAETKEKFYDDIRRIFPDADLSKFRKG